MLNAPDGFTLCTYCGGLNYYLPKHTDPVCHGTGFERLPS
jgi:hypothetical protein